MKVQDVGCELQKHAQLNFTGCLLFNAESSGSIPHVYFNNGLVYAAQYGSFRGKHALQHILRIPSPTLDERYGDTYGHKEMDQPLDELLVEAMQAEWTGTELPEPEPPPVSRLNLGSSGPLRDENGISPYVFIFFSMKQEWVLDTGRYILGRSESCHVCIPDDSISSFHCVIDIAGGQATVLDYNSTNGTYLNGTKVEDAVPLQPGELLTLGNFDLSLRTALRARHAKKVIHPFAIDMNGMGGERFLTPPPKPEPPKAPPKKELALPIKDGAIRYKKADSSKGQTWTVSLPRFFSKK